MILCNMDDDGGRRNGTVDAADKIVDTNRDEPDIAEIQVRRTGTPVVPASWTLQLHILDDNSLNACIFDGLIADFRRRSPYPYVARILAVCFRKGGIEGFTPTANIWSRRNSTQSGNSLGQSSKERCIILCANLRNDIHEFGSGDLRRTRRAIAFFRSQQRKSYCISECRGMCSAKKLSACCQYSGRTCSRKSISIVGDLFYCSSCAAVSKWLHNITV